MSARAIAKAEWTGFFDSFSRHYRGRTVDVQILGEKLGLYTLAHGQPLIGITAQVKTAPHEIQLMAGDGSAHVTHVIKQPSEVWVEQGKDGEDSALRIVSEEETAVLIQLESAQLCDSAAKPADCPIGGSKSAAERPLIVVAVDNSDPALWAASVGGKLAQGLGAEILLTHVINATELFAADEFALTKAYAALKDAAKEAIEAAKRLVPATVRTSSTIEEGEPAARIAEICGERGAVYVVIGSHGRGRVSQLLLGSTAAAVARLARCPVLVVSHLPEGQAVSKQHTEFSELARA